MAIGRGESKVIYNGIDTEKFRPDLQVRTAVRSSLKIGDDEILAIHVARLDPLKNHAMFLDALRASPKICGLLVGAGTETLPLPENALALGLRSDVDQLYASADLVISTSFAELFGITVAEGMSSACVPIATDVGSFQMIIGDTGRVIATDDKKALVAALANAAAMDRSERTALGMRARARIIERFSLQRMVDNYARLYASDA